MAKRPEIVRDVAGLRKLVAGWRRSGRRIALVPTMGALHDGHLALIAAARRHADRVVVSIFVNPTQFAPHEDFDAYPRDEAGDIARAQTAKASAVYAPGMAAMYSDAFATRIDVAGVSQGLCGASRPHHFAGVATVVTKLLLQALPDVALFGEKDYQQLMVVRRLVADLDIPVDIIGVPTLREADGLAMSSRNARLTPEERAVAPVLHRILEALADDLARGRVIDEALAQGRSDLALAGFRLDYLEVREAVGLTPVEGLVAGPARLLAAAHLGRVRLIDNVPVRLRNPQDDPPAGRRQVAGGFRVGGQ